MLEILSNKSNTATINIEMERPNAPFIIRGHHLRHIAQLVQKKITPADQARMFREARERDLASQSLGDRKYAFDTIGDSQESHEAYESAIRENAERFLALPDDHPVLLVAESRDGMCDACAIGDHCVATFNIRDDQSLIYDFYNSSRRFGFGSHVLIVVDVVETEVAPPREVRNLLTTAGVIKQVLGRRYTLQPAKRGSGYNAF